MPELSLPTDPELRHHFPLAQGLFDYFPNALAEVAHLSLLATQQHHPDKEMHWDRDKSTDHDNKLLRHFMDRGNVEEGTGLSHTVFVAWRALAMLQVELEEARDLPLPRGCRHG